MIRKDSVEWTRDFLPLRWKSCEVKSMWNGVSFIWAAPPQLNCRTFVSAHRLRMRPLNVAAHEALMTGILSFNESCEQIVATGTDDGASPYMVEDANTKDLKVIEYGLLVIKHWRAVAALILVCIRMIWMEAKTIHLKKVPCTNICMQVEHTERRGQWKDRDKLETNQHVWVPIRVDHAKIRTKTILCCSSLNSLLLVLLIVVDGSAVYDVVSPIRSSVSDMISDMKIYLFIYYCRDIFWC